MGFASKIAAGQNPNMPGTYAGAPPSGYTGGPPASLQPGGKPYQAYPGSPPPPLPQGSSQYSPYGGSPAQPHHQPYGTPTPPAPPAGYSRPPPGPPGQPPAPYPAQPQQSYSRPPPPPPNQPYGAGSPYPGQQPPHGQPSPYPPQGPPYPGAQGHPGPPPGPPGGQYGPPGGAAPPAAPATPQQVAAYRQLLIGTIQEKNLQNFYPPERLDRLVQSLAVDAPGKLNRLMHEWSVPMEVATDVMKLSLYDVVLYVDDSGSIEFEEKGLRKDQLRQILGLVATAASIFDQDGISIRFMNSMEVGDGIRSADDVNRLVSRVRFAGLTPLGTSLRNKVIDPMVVGPARSNRLDKPVLVIAITDGQPAGEPHGAVGDAIRLAVDEVSRTRYGKGAVAFQFTQVGTDQRAREFLGDLDEDPQIGPLIDCTSNFEVEQDEMSRANPPIHLTRELWCAKLMLGAIDASYDTKDEKRAGGPPPAGPPPAQYGGYGSAPGGSYPPGPPSYNPQSGYQQQQPPYPPSNQGPPYGQPQPPYGYSPHPPAGPSQGYPPPGPYGQPPPRY